MTEKFFLGVDPGHGVEQYAGCVMTVDGDQIGVLRSFEVREERSTQPIFKLKEGVYEIPKSVVYEIPIAKMWVNEAWLRETLLDAEFNESPARERFP